MYNERKIVGTSRHPQRTEQSSQYKRSYNLINLSITGIPVGIGHFTHEYIVFPVNDSSGNIYLKYYEVDAGPEEPKLEEYTGFYTDQEIVTCDLGNSQFIFLEHYKPEIVYLSKVRQEDRWQVDGHQDRYEKIIRLMLC